ncbi:hypothetical protein F5888DRAFT_1131783 [Russula emetica]|nr:hypothetical protein F5888DRAFT_1131783 [Russula emetica]
MQHSQQVQFFPDPSLPPGQGDLEALERLKEIIKSNQHEIFRATPRPAALASLYKGSLLSAVPPHPEQIPNNPKEKPTTAPSSPTFEKPSSSTFIRDAHSAHVVAAVQGATRPSISNDTLPSNVVNPRDQSHLLTNGHLTSQQNANDSLNPTTSQLRDTSARQVIDANGSSVTVSLGSSPPRPLRDSAFSPRDFLRRDVPTDTLRMQQQLPSSPERRNPGPDINPSTRPSLYTSGRDQPPLREMRPYDHERDFNRVHETHEQDRERMRERRWSLTDHRRFDQDRRSFDNDRRFPPDGRRRPSYDRRPPQSDDRRPPHFEDKQHPSFVDRRIPDYEHRPLSEEVDIGNAQSQDRPQEAFLGNERHIGPAQAMKTRVPLLSSVPPPNAAAVSMAPANPTAEGATTGDHRPSVSSSVPIVVDTQGTSASPFAPPLKERSSQVPSLHERISGTYSQIGPRAESTRPGPFPEERPTEPLGNPGATLTSLPGSNGPVDDLLHNRVSEPPHATNSRLGLNDDQERYSKPTGDNHTRPVSAAYSRALSVGRDELRPQPPPPLSASTPSAFSSTQPSPSLRTREPSRERPSNVRPYFRSEFNRPSEDARRLDAQPGDSLRRYDERARWSPPPYGDRRGYRDYYDRDRPYWDNKERTRVLPMPTESMPPSYWDRERTRYPEPSYTGGGPRQTV